MKVYLVGGAVRDALMDVPNNDRDFVVVGATEQEMLDLGFTNVGESFPVFLHPETGDEYALARRERKTGAGYRGFSVEFDADITLAEDLSRRDLTINAMARDLETGEVVDPYGGMDDLNACMLRHVGTAFVEDPLRVVRLARFYARFVNFQIHPDTMMLAQDIVNSGEMDALADERFWAEMEKMFEQSHEPLRFFNALWHFGALQKVKFFKNVFGHVSSGKYMKDFPRYIQPVTYAENSLMLFVATVAGEDAQMTSKALPARVVKLFNNVKMVRSLGMATPEKVVEVLNKNRGWDPESQSLDDLMDAMDVAEQAGDRFFVSPVLLLQCARAGRNVKADAYLGLPGAEIGKAMAADRLRAVTDVMRNWK